MSAAMTARRLNGRVRGISTPGGTFIPRSLIPLPGDAEKESGQEAVGQIRGRRAT
jgi:hypothetical protein